MHKPLKETTELLLEVASCLISGGANTHRVHHNINRIAETLEIKPHMMIMHNAILISVVNPVNGETYSQIKKIPPFGVNFKLVSGISHLSWAAYEEKWSLEQIRDRLHKYIEVAHYHRWQILLFVGLADAGFCYNFGGDFISMFLSFIATVLALFCRQELVRRKFNAYIAVYVSSFVASLVGASSIYFNLGTTPEFVMATCVLFLIPGVPLINAFTDFFDGNFLNGVARAINGMSIAFAISLGMLTAIQIFQINF